MKIQLKLSEKQLLEIGFKRKIFVDKEYKTKAVTFNLKGKTNDEIYYNPDEKIYLWYYKTTLGDSANHINLDITDEANLFMILQVFGFKYKI